MSQETAQPEREQERGNHDRQRRRYRLPREHSRVRESRLLLRPIHIPVSVTRAPCTLVCDQAPQVSGVLLGQGGAEVELALGVRDHRRSRLLTSKEIPFRLRQQHEEHDEDERRDEPESEQRLCETDQEEAPVAHRRSAPNSRFTVSDAT